VVFIGNYNSDFTIALKQLACSSKFKCSRNVLNTTYKTYIKPILQYGSNTLITVTPKSDETGKAQN